LAVVRHPVKEFLEAWRGLSYGKLLAAALGRADAVTLEEVIADTTGTMKRASDKLAGNDCEKRLFNRQVQCQHAKVCSEQTLSSQWCSVNRHVVLDRQLLWVPCWSLRIWCHLCS